METLRWDVHKRFSRFQTNVINGTSIFAESYELTTILEEYSKRNSKYRSRKHSEKFLHRWACNSKKKRFLWCTRFFFSVSTVLQNVYPVWKTNRGAGQPFVFQADIKYPVETLQYPLQLRPHALSFVAWHLCFWAECVKFFDRPRGGRCCHLNPAPPKGAKEKQNAVCQSYEHMFS